MSLLCRVLLFWALLIIELFPTPAASEAVGDWIVVASAAVNHFNKGEVEAAEQELSHLVASFDAGSDRLTKSLVQLLLARMLVAADRNLETAKALLQDAEVYIGDTLGLDSPELGQAWHLEGRILLLEGDFRSAEDVLRKALAVAKRGYGSDSYQVAIILADLVVVYSKLGRPDIAQPLKSRVTAFFAPAPTVVQPVVQPVSQSEPGAERSSPQLTSQPISQPSPSALAGMGLSRGTRAYIISIAIILFFTAIHFLLSFSRLESFFRFGIFCCVSSLATGSIAVATISRQSSEISLRAGLLVVALLSVLNLMVSALGMSYCSYSAIVDAPLIRAVLRRRMPTLPWLGWVVHIGIVTSVGAAYMHVFAWVTSRPQLVSPLIPWADSLTRNASLFAVVSLTLAIAITEALIFRLFLQNFVAAVAQLSASRYLLAITVAATLWALGYAQLGHSHLGMVGSFRFLQLLPVGIALGYLARRQGIESAIIAQLLISLTL